MIEIVQISFAMILTIYWCNGRKGSKLGLTCENIAVISVICLCVGMQDAANESEGERNTRTGSRMMILVKCINLWNEMNETSCRD